MYVHYSGFALRLQQQPGLALLPYSGAWSFFTKNIFWITQTRQNKLKKFTKTSKNLQTSGLIGHSYFPKQNKKHLELNAVSQGFKHGH